MSSTVDSLILDLLEWIGPNARPYAEVIEAWRTSCPRLPVWSSPKVTIKGEPAGTPELDNARVIAEQAARVAAFRESRAEQQDRNMREEGPLR